MHVSRLAKGIIAGGLGLALLIGGGTFALWSDSTSVDSGSINSGALTVDADEGTWSNVATDPISTIEDLGSYRIVPGDELQFSTTLHVTAIGDNLKAQLSVDTSELSGDQPLLDALETVFTASGLAPAGTNTFTVEPSSSVQDISVTVTITFEDVDGLTAQGETVDLSALEFTLDQLPG